MTDSYRARAKKINDDCYSTELAPYDLVKEIEQALIQVEKEGSEKWHKAGFEDGIRTAAETVMKAWKAGISLHETWYNVSALLGQQESRIESEGKIK